MPFGELLTRRIWIGIAEARAKQLGLSRVGAVQRLEELEDLPPEATQHLEEVSQRERSVLAKADELRALVEEAKLAQSNREDGDNPTFPSTLH